MTPNNLKQLEQLSRETLNLQNELKRIRSASEVSALNYSNAGGSGGTGDAVSRMACSAADIEAEISCKEKQMNTIIDTERKSDMRELLRLRFVHRLSWNKIAAKMYYSSGSTPFRLYRRFCRKLRKSGNGHGNA